MGPKRTSWGEQIVRIAAITLVLMGIISLLAWGFKTASPLLKGVNGASALRVTQGEEVPFALNSVDPSSDGSFCLWDFGDGTPLTEAANPTHVFEKSGTYTVTVTAPDAEGADRDTKFEVVVEESNDEIADNSGANSHWSTYWAKRGQAVVTGYTIKGTDQTTELSKSQVAESNQVVERAPANQQQAVLMRAPAPSDGAFTSQAELVAAQQILDKQIIKNPILKGTTIFIRDCPNNWQGCAFYELGIIWIDPDHRAPLEEIVIHECNHIIDWREDGDIDYDDS